MTAPLDDQVLRELYERLDISAISTKQREKVRAAIEEQGQ